MKKKLLFLNTNGTWGGSEILWTESAKRFLKKGWSVKAGVYLDFETVENVLSSGENYLDLRQRFKGPGMWQRIIQKLHLRTFNDRDLLMEELSNNTPDLVIISQGNNKDGEGLMQCCSDLSVPFINIVHLVSESLWPGLNDEKIDRLNNLFEKAAVNYFVSGYVWRMHEKLLATSLKNAKIIYNPHPRNANEDIDFPQVKNGLYKVALVGRLENFHKGYDLLIDVVKQKKWQERAISFSIFGRGPHAGLIRRMIQQQGIKNIHVYQHTENIADIWREHHILMMPSRMEGQSLTLIEAMRFKRAAIATNVGGVDELIEDNKSGFIAAYPTATHIDEALERAWLGRILWEKMGEIAFEHISTKHPQDATGYFIDEVEVVANKSGQ